MAAPPRPAIRRPISITVVSVGLVVVAALTLVVVPVLLLVDLVTRASARRTRIWLLLFGALWFEAVTLVAMTVCAVRYFGRLDCEVAQDRFHRIQWWWGARHLRTLRRLVGVRWLVENPEELEHGNAIVLSRHANHIDALLPLLLHGVVGRFRLRYTLKDDLQWQPTIDIMGNLLPNVFVDRSPAPDSRLWDEMTGLAAGVDERSVAVLFPEGTFFTPDQRDHAVARLARTSPELEAPALTLQHLLPPRPAGTRALLRGAPTADIVLVAHEGMESFGDLASIRRNLPLRDPVRVRLWRIPRQQVPTDEDELGAWLLDRWIDLDRWIGMRVIERSEGDGRLSTLVGAKEMHP